MEAWIGLAHVRPLPGNDLLEGAMGAFVTVVALAYSQDDFLSQARSKLQSYEFEIVEIEDIEPWEVRTKHFPVDEHIQGLVRSLGSDNRVLLGTFHDYENE
jgi:hypothetical protein